MFHLREVGKEKILKVEEKVEEKVGANLEKVVNQRKDQIQIDE